MRDGIILITLVGAFLLAAGDMARAQRGGSFEAGEPFDAPSEEGALKLDLEVESRPDQAAIDQFEWERQQKREATGRFRCFLTEFDGRRSAVEQRQRCEDIGR